MKFPSICNCFILHIFQFFDAYYVIVFFLFAFFNRNRLQQILTILLSKSIPQSALGTPFRAPVPNISHLDKLGFNPEKSKKRSKVLKTSATDFSSFQKKFSVISLVFLQKVMTEYCSSFNAFVAFD